MTSTDVTSDDPTATPVLPVQRAGDDTPVAPPEADDHRWRRPGRGVALVLAIIAGLAAQGRLNDALGLMHLPGTATGTFGGISGPQSLWSPTTAAQTLVGWHAWDRAQLSVGHGIHVLATLILVTVVGLLLVTLPLVALIRTATRATTRRFPTLGNDEGAEAYASDLAAVAATADGRAWPLVFVGGIVARDVLLLVAWAAVPGAAPILVRVAGAVTAVAWLAIAVPVLLMAYAHLAADIGARHDDDDSPGALRRFGRVVVILRIQIVAAAVLPAILLALGGGLGEQVDDLALRWPAHLWPLLAAIGAAIGLSVLLRETGYLCRDWYAGAKLPSGAVPSGRVSLFGGAVLLAGYIASVLTSTPMGVLLWPGLAFFALGLVTEVEKHRTLRVDGNTTQPVRVRPAPVVEPELDTTPLTDAAIPLLAAVPLAAIAYVAVRAGVSLVVRDARVFSTGSSFLVAAALMFGLCWVFAGLGRPKWPWRLAAGVAFGAIAIASAVRPIPMGQAVGALALLLAFSGVLLMILVAIVFAVRNLRPSAPLAVLRLRRVPVLTFIVVWMLVTSIVQGTDHYHDVRLMAATTTKPRPVTPSEAVSEWLAEHGGAAAANPASGRAPVSMVFVATYGGGIRSAYWTNLVLDCLFAPAAEPAAAAPSCSGQKLDESSVFAESGVSGGAVGIAMHRVLGDKAFTPVLDQDFVSPDIAAMVFRDAPSFWIPAPFKSVGHDRAAVMETSWERASGGAMSEGLFASAWQSPTQLRFPLTVFGSATVDDGCRLNASVLAAATKDETASSTGCYTMAPFAPVVGQQVGSAGFTETGSPGAPTQSEPVLAGTKDLYDYLCAPGDPANSRDIALSSAALLAARFPYISPTGGLTGCNNDPTAKQSRTFTMDGGVIDNSGASALGELWSGIAGQVADYDNDATKPSCVEPRLLIINNGYADPAPAAIPHQPQELLAPALGDAAAGDAATARDEQRTALEFQHAFGSVVCRGVAAIPPRTVATRVALIEPSARPGPFAPLGWSLSTYATDDLADQLGTVPNRCEMAVVRTWLAPEAPDPFAAGGPCTVGPTSAAGG